MPEKGFEIHNEVHKYSHSAYSQRSFLFYSDLVIKSYEGTQQGDPESPAFFQIPLNFQGLIDNLKSKKNL